MESRIFLYFQNNVSIIILGSQTCHKMIYLEQKAPTMPGNIAFRNLLDSGQLWVPSVSVLIASTAKFGTQFILIDIFIYKSKAIQKGNQVRTQWNLERNMVGTRVPNVQNHPCGQLASAIKILYLHYEQARCKIFERDSCLGTLSLLWTFEKNGPELWESKLLSMRKNDGT